MRKIFLIAFIALSISTLNAQKKSKRLLHFFDECIESFEKDEYDSVFYFCNQFEKSQNLTNTELYYVNAMRGYLNFELGNNNQAFSHYKKSIALIDDSNPDRKKLIAHASSIIAGNYFSMQNYNSAYYYANKAINSEVRNGIRAEMFQILGYCEFKKKNYEIAEKHLLKAKEIHLGMNGDEFMLANCFSKLIELYNVQNRNDLVEYYAKQGESLAIKSDNKNSLKLFWKSLEKVSLQKKELDKAYFYRNKVDSIVDIINLKENNEQINNLNIKYQTELKTEENKKLKALNYFKDSKIKNQTILFFGSLFIVLFSLIFIFVLFRLNKKRKMLFCELELKNKQIINQNSVLERQHHLNQRIFGLISHDIKEPLILTGLSLKQFNQTNSKENLIKLEGQISNSNLILNNLLKWAKIELNYTDNSDKKTNVNDLFKEIVKEFEIQINEKNLVVKSRISKDFSIQIHKEVLRISLRNIISNAIKFSLKNSQINLGSNSEKSIFIEDFGIGISDSLKTKLFNENVQSSIGTIGEQGFGIGLQFTKELLEKYNFKLFLDDSCKNSTCFVIQEN